MLHPDLDPVFEVENWNSDLDPDLNPDLDSTFQSNAIRDHNLNHGS